MSKGKKEWREREKKKEGGREVRKRVRDGGRTVISTKLFTH